MKTLDNYEVDLSDYNDELIDSIEEEFNSDRIKELLKTNMLRLEYMPDLYTRNGYLDVPRYLMIKMEYTIGYCTNLVLNKKDKKLIMNIVFDEKYKKLKLLDSNQLYIGLRGLINKSNKIKIICFDVKLKDVGHFEYIENGKVKIIDSHPQQILLVTDNQQI